MWDFLNTCLTVVPFAGRDVAQDVAGEPAKWKARRWGGDPAPTSAGCPSS